MCISSFRSRVCSVRLGLSLGGLGIRGIRLGLFLCCLSFLCIGLSLLLLPCRIVSLLLRFCLCIRGGLEFVRLPFLVYPLNGDRARVFGSLYCLSGDRDQLLSRDVLFRGIFICIIHQLESVLIAVAGVLLGSLGLRDTQCIASFEEFQRQLGIQNHRVEPVAGRNVAAAFEKVMLGIECFGSSLGISANYVFKHYDVARLAHGIVRFRRDDQSECLEVRGDVQLAAVVIAHQYFAQIHCPALG